MPWSNKQKAKAMQACGAAGIDDDHRKLILRQFRRAMFNRTGGAAAGPSFTSLRLNDSDYEQFMAIVERAAGGQVLDYSRGYWQSKADDDGQRLRHLAGKLAAELIVDGLLNADSGVAGWIRGRVNSDKSSIEELNADELYKLVEGFKSFGRRQRKEVGVGR